MIVDRRTTLAVLMSGTVLGATRAGAVAPRPTVVFIDGRRPASRAFAARAAGSRIIDIAAPHAPFWEEVRAFTPDGARVRGLTRWSDWVLLRGVLQDKGLRVRAETAVDPAGIGGGALFLWEMS